MQKKNGFAPLGPADGTVMSAIFGYNAARFYKLDLRAELAPMQVDGIATLKAAYRSLCCPTSTCRGMDGLQLLAEVTRRFPYLPDHDGYRLW
jgi:hypothetical protein